MIRMNALLCSLVAAAIFGAATSAADDKAAASKEQLAKVQKLVGQWRGVGQPQRGSTKDSWVEEADWAWEFEGEISLIAKLPKGKYFSSLMLLPGKTSDEYALAATRADDGKVVWYRGSLDADERLVLNAEEEAAGIPSRLSFRFVAGGDRLLVVLERKAEAGEQFVRLAEVGYTRRGSGFGKGSSQPECVVTGGLGTIEVSYEGKTYYVCCTGCQAYFNENPAEVLAEYKARKAEEAAKRNK